MNLEQVDKTPALPQGAPLYLYPVFRARSSIRKGQLDLLLADGRRWQFTGSESGVHAEMQLQRPLRLLRRLLTRGALGLGEGFMAGDWSTTRLSDLLHLLSANEQHFGGLSNGRKALQLLDRLQHRLRRNSRRGSRRNIGYHYDLGNDFYRAWLDQTMSYSCALFAHPDERLEQAQQRKYQRLLDELDARPGQHVLEIGCGWGGFALQAARQGVRVTGITLSRQQLDFARHRVRQAGLEHLIELRMQDYRDLSETFDHIVSIEMFEAVGEDYWDDYFRVLRQCLRPAGRAALQVITIDDAYFEQYRAGSDFIQKYIFPGGLLPSPEVFREYSDRAGLATLDRAFFADHYASTLRRWHQQLQAGQHETRIRRMGERFLRMWHYYLAYCEAGFRSGRIDVMQVVLSAAGSGRSAT